MLTADDIRLILNEQEFWIEDIEWSASYYMTKTDPNG